MNKTYAYPLAFRFKIATLSNDFEAKDAQGHTLFYAREKIMTWRDVIKVYSDSSKREQLYTLRSNKLIDFQQTFSIINIAGEELGKIRRKSIKSLWRSTFELRNPAGDLDYSIEERSVWTKFWDSIFGEIPIIGALSGYVFNPSYILKDKEGVELFEIKKMPSFFGRKFEVHKLVSSHLLDEERLVLSMVLTVLIERDNG